jgi:hypothetical protein
MTFHKFFFCAIEDPDIGNQILAWSFLRGYITNARQDQRNQEQYFRYLPHAIFPSVLIASHGSQAQTRISKSDRWFFAIPAIFLSTRAPS